MNMTPMEIIAMHNSTISTTKVQVANQNMYTEIPNPSPYPEYLNQHFDCGNMRLISLKGVPKYVVGGFGCSRAGLFSLQYGPEVVGGSFECCNNILTSLQYAPHTVGGDVVCYNNDIRTYHNIHKIFRYIGGAFWGPCGTNVLGFALIEGLTAVTFDGGPDGLGDIVTRHLGDVHLLQEALLEAGLREYAQL